MWTFVCSCQVAQNGRYALNTRGSKVFYNWKIVNVFTARKRSFRRLCFYRCLSFCPQGGGHAWLLRGGCVVARGGMHGCSGGGMHGCYGGMRGCYRGHAWLLWGVCMVALGGHARLLQGWQHAWLGGMRGFFDEIRSMSGRYASYWNAFLFHQKFKILHTNCTCNRS